MTCDPKTISKLPGKLLFFPLALEGPRERSRESLGKDPPGEAQPCLGELGGKGEKGKLEVGDAPGAAASAPGNGHGK